MKLVICEKNIAARRIASILSNGNSKYIRMGSIPVYEFTKDSEQWKIIGLKGHIINLDFPKDYNIWNKIPPKDLINVPPEKRVSERGIASALKSLVSGNPFLIVATDFDREGELIGVEVIDLLKKYNQNITDIKRAKFSAITNYEINNAFSNLSEVDYNISSAGESRQIIDLIWGAVLTRFISLTARKVGKDFLSIGRVQSPTLALLVKREKEIQSFVPKPYWRIIARLKKDILFEAVHTTGQFWDKKEVEQIFEKIKNSNEAIVKKIQIKKNNERPPAPFSTTTFLQAASGLGISTSQAMKIAEELYMNGLISYPRTDNTVYPSSLNLRNILNKLKQSSFSKETQEVINNGRDHPTRGSKKTTDHPPIHPVSAPSQELIGNSKRIYELIVRRFLATLAKDAISESIEAIFDILGESFKSTGYRIIEANWKNIYTYIKSYEKQLPQMNEKEIINVININLKEDVTKPPKRYSQGNLIAEMEKLLLGTKSTRHEIINKLYNRRYITLTPLAPTPVAIAVIDSMNDCDVTKPKMTAELEEDMNRISEGNKTLDETVEESRNMLTKVMIELEKDKDKINTTINEAHKKQNTIGQCPRCNNDLLIRNSKKGKRFVGCSGYPSCTNTYPLPQSGGIQVTGEKCPKCSAPLIKIRLSGKKPWEICINPKCTKDK
jgi:DNA topoisomerase-1